MTDYLELRYLEQVESQTRYLGPGRPGPHRTQQTVETQTWTVKTQRRRAALNHFNRLAGWRVYVTHAPKARLSLAGAVNCDRQQGQPEQGFHRLKGGLLAITPLFLKDDYRIRGLLLLLGITLRVLTLTELVARRSLAATGETLKGLYAGNPQRATDQPTAERLLKAFDNLTLYRHQTTTEVCYEVTELNPLQRRILQLLKVPEAVYNPLAAVLIDSGGEKITERCADHSHDHKYFGGRILAGFVHIAGWSRSRARDYYDLWRCCEPAAAPPREVCEGEGATIHNQNFP